MSDQYQVIINNQRLELARLKNVLEKIASCDSHHPDDIVALARGALAQSQEGILE